MSLSVCMIVKNEAENLPHCLASLGDIPAEVLVFDTGSTDNTMAVARDLGAQVDKLPWEDDFSAARNASIESAKGDWILVLDADETLTEAGRHCLKALLAQEPLGDSSPADLLLVTWLRHERNAQQSPYSQVSRLFRNHADLRFNRPYHETVDDSIEALVGREPHWQVAYLEAVALEHTGYTADAIATRQKFQRAKTLMEKHLAQHPQDAYLCNKLGALYGQQGDWQTGLNWIRQGLAASEDALDALTCYELHYHAGLAYRHLNRPDQAAAEYQRAIDSPVPDVLKLGALLNLGSLYKQQGKLLESINLFESVIQIDDTQAIAYFNLGVAHRARGYLEPAVTAYQNAIARDPHYAEAYQNLGVVLFKLGKLPESKAAFQKAMVCYQKTNPAEALKLQQGIANLGL